MGRSSRDVLQHLLPMTQKEAHVALKKVELRKQPRDVVRVAVRRGRETWEVWEWTIKVQLL